MAKTAAQIFADQHVTIFGVHAVAITYTPSGAAGIATTAYVHDLGEMEIETERGIIKKRLYRVDVLKTAVATITPNFDKVTYGSVTIIITSREHEEGGKWVLKGELQTDEELSNGTIRRKDE